MCTYAGGRHGILLGKCSHLYKFSIFFVPGTNDSVCVVTRFHSVFKIYKGFEWQISEGLSHVTHYTLLQ